MLSTYPLRPNPTTRQPRAELAPLGLPAVTTLLSATAWRGPEEDASGDASRVVSTCCLLPRLLQPELSHIEYDPAYPNPIST